MKTVSAYLLATLFLTAHASAITLTTSSYTTMGVRLSSTSTYTVVFTNAVSVTNPEPAWHDQPISWHVGTGLTNCSPGSLQNVSFCCIGLDGNSATSVETDDLLTCEIPIEAMGESFASIGGYGLLPYASVDALSGCVRPCEDRPTPGCT